nr:MAG TPA: ABC-type bacteriocin transporter [Caudoviricetes sp.]
MVRSNYEQGRTQALAHRRRSPRREDGRPDGRDAHRLDRRGHHVARLGPDRGRSRVHRSGIGTHLNRRSPGGRGGYLAVCDAALALLAASVLVFLSLELGMPQVRTAGKAIPTVYDKDAPAQVPTYLQTDERWGALPYAGDDIATSGCGLTSAAMAYTRLTGEEWTPLRLALTVGDTCTTDGLNDMQKFCTWMCANDGDLSSTGLIYDQQEALGYAGRGWMVFGSMTGQLHEGGRAYGGHIVLICGWDGGAADIRDPDEGQVNLNTDEFASVSWAYFIAIGSD